MKLLLFMALVVALLGLGGACTTMNSARPLEPGEHAVAVTAGGPLVHVPNVGPIPMPHVTLEGRHGLVHKLDLSYGVHLLPAVFGVAGAHVGGTFLLAAERGGGIPALAVSQRVFGFTNRLDFRKPVPGDWLLSQTDLTASWLVYDQLLYAGLTGYVPILQPYPYLAPFAGVEFRPFVDWARIQLEARWLAPYQDTRFGVVDWIAPGDRGAIVLNAGVAFVFDLRPHAEEEAP